MSRAVLGGQLIESIFLSPGVKIIDVNFGLALIHSIEKSYGLYLLLYFYTRLKNLNVIYNLYLKTHTYPTLFSESGGRQYTPVWSKMSQFVWSKISVFVKSHESRVTRDGLQMCGICLLVEFHWGGSATN